MDSKVVRFKKRRNINIGIIIFLIIFVYIAINVYLYYTKKHITIYEVQEGSNVQNNTVPGLILREEQIVYTGKAGYITYFQKEGARVAKNSSVYSIDDSRQIYDILMSGEVPITISEQNHAQMQYEIRSFRKQFSDSNFEIVEGFKEDVNDMVYDIMNSTMVQYGQDIQDTTGLQYTYDITKAEKSGIITYYIDSFEDVKPEQVTMDMFQTENYQRTNLRTADMTTEGSPAFKLITSDEWTIMLPLTQELYGKLADKQRITFTILKDDFKTTANISFSQKGSDYIARIDLDKNMPNYLNDRYLEIELNIDMDKGLKIPASSIVEKEFYMVPLSYFTTGGDQDSSSNGVVKETYDDVTGEVSYKFVETDIYYQDDTYGYVDTALFEPNTMIYSVKEEDSYQLNRKGSLKGVFNVNMGYAVFKRIEILFEGKDYYIIKTNTPNGLSKYDHIALDSSTAVEQAIIY